MLSHYEKNYCRTLTGKFPADTQYLKEGYKHIRLRYQRLACAVEEISEKLPSLPALTELVDDLGNLAEALIIGDQYRN